MAFDVAIVKPQALLAALAQFLGIIPNGIPEFGTLLASLQHAINSIFIHFHLGGAISKHEIALSSLLTHFRGLGINNCVGSASLSFQSSQEDSTLLVKAITNPEVATLFG